MSNELNTAAQIAAALRHAADRIDTLGDIELDPIALQINLQAVTYDGTPEGRKATVDHLSFALTGHTGELQEDNQDAESKPYRTHYDARLVNQTYTVAVYTNLTDAAIHPSKRAGAR